MQEITRIVANVFSFYAIIAIEHVFSMYQHSPAPLESVENLGLRSRFSIPLSGPGECSCMKKKNMFDPYIDHKIFPAVIISLPLIQEGQLSVSAGRMRTNTG